MDQLLAFFTQFTPLDAALAFLIVGFTVYGFLKGIIQMIGELAGYVLGIWVAGQYFIPFFEWTQSLYMGYDEAGRAISFIVLILITRKLVVLAVLLIDKFFNFIGLIPFFSLVNRTAGALFGFVSILMVLGVLTYFVSRYSVGFGFDKMLVASSVPQVLIPIGEFFSPLLPEAVERVHSLL